MRRASSAAGTTALTMASTPIAWATVKADPGVSSTRGRPMYSGYSRWAPRSHVGSADHSEDGKPSHMYSPIVR